jgi:hypothetical protein
MARGNEKALCTYWVDALCIDQANPAERVHQVAQMGDIFSRAIRVYLWLGANATLAPTLRILQDPEAATPQDWALIGTNRTALEGYICGNQYWERAWVIQEIFLAKSVIVWADAEPLLFEHLHWTIDYFYLAWKDKPIAQFKLHTKGTPDTKRLTSKFVEAKTLYQGAGLKYLLLNFRDKRCEIPRDRIFSLLSMSSEGPNIKVDYSSPAFEIWLDILVHLNSTACVCSPGLIAQSLQLEEKLALKEVADAVLDSSPQIKIPGLTFQPPWGIILDGGMYLVSELELTSSIVIDDVVSRCDHTWPCSSFTQLMAKIMPCRYIQHVGPYWKAKNTFSLKTISPDLTEREQALIVKHAPLWVAPQADNNGSQDWSNNRLYNPRERLESTLTLNEKQARGRMPWAFVDVHGFHVIPHGGSFCTVRIPLRALQDVIPHVPVHCTKTSSSAAPSTDPSEGDGASTQRVSMQIVRNRATTRREQRTTKLK